MPCDEFTRGAYVNHHGAIFQMLARVLYGDESKAPVNENGNKDYSGYESVRPSHGK
jgi:hypothetical protein